ncbi:MAG TPA: cation:proton antiporter [Terriglobales bacterium]|nr:cation:proton antiporter [Terriglobales bacterium]
MPHGANPLLLDLFLIFILAKLLGEIFERFRLPAVLGEILAGVVFGPYALGWVTPSPSVHSFAELGAIFLLFTVGLETHPKDLIRVGSKALGVALAGVVVPFAFGFAYMMLRYGQTQEAIFVAAAMVATSVGITARVLGDMKVLQTRAARIILAAAVFDDILAMILLAVVAGLGSAGGVQWLHLGVLFAEAIAFALFMIFVAPRVMHRMRPRLEKMSVPNAPLLASLALCLGLSVAAEKIGMAAIIGAFFAGLAFAEYSPEWNLQPRVHAINEFLAPFFFFTMGTRLDLEAFTPEVLISAAVISVLALISKVGGCGLPVLREGWLTALQVGVGMMPRGEVGLIVALVGLNLGAISQSSYAIVIFMTAVTTLLAPPILRVLFRRGEDAVAD